MGNTLKKLINRIRRGFSRGTVHYPAVLALPLFESFAGEPLTFITLPEWLSAPWPDFCPSEEWEINPGEATIREDSALYGL